MRRALDPSAVREALVTSLSPWSEVEILAQVDSTNAHAARRSTPWLVVVAEEQTAGRGRLGRTWATAPLASLAVSAVLPTPSSALGWVPLLAGLALHRAIGEVAGVRTELKWPNDVLAPGDADRKVCGVLCELIGAGVVVGAGINVDQSREELSVDTATSLRLCGAAGVSRQRLLTAYLTELVSVHADLTGSPRARAAIQDDYRAVCRTLGSVVDLDRGSGVTRVRARSVDGEGRLVVETEAGGGPRTEAVAAGDITHVRDG